MGDIPHNQLYRYRYPIVMRIGRVCIGISVLIPFMYILIGLLQGDGYYDLFFNGLLAYTIVPCTMAGVWMWFSDNAGRFINGFDNVRIELRNRFANYYGPYIVISMTLISLSVSLMMMAKTAWAFLIIAISIIVLIYPIRYLNDRVTDKRIILGDASDKVKIMACIVVSLLVLIPVAITDQFSSEAVKVDVSFNDDDITIKAPMFDHTFSYSQVEVLTLEPDFDKGIRVYGYGSSTILSGVFKNDSFGRYDLASYAKVSCCIVFSVNGDMYAFNQDSDESTRNAFDVLSSHIDRLS